MAKAMETATNFIKFSKLRHVLFDLLAGNSNLAKSLSEKGNHVLGQDENPHKGWELFPVLVTSMHETDSL